VKGQTAITNILKAEGVEWVTCYPDGGTASNLIAACADTGIRTIQPRCERVVVNIADGFTRVTNGRPNGVAIVGGGQTAGVAFSGISQAFSDNVPMLILGGAPIRDRVGQRQIQDYDPIHTYLKVTKWVETINYAYRVPELMRRAFTYLRNGRPSPVVLVSPHDVMYEELPDEVFRYTPISRWTTPGNPHDVTVAVRAILNAKTPLIYAGEGTLYAEAWDELREFAELLQVPVMTTMKGKSVFPENHPLSVGHGGRTGPKHAAHFYHKADLVFCIGASLQRGAGADMSGRVIIQVDVDEYYINKDHISDYAIIGDAKLVLRQVIEEVKRQTTNGRRNDAMVTEIENVKNEFLKEWMPLLTSNEVPINSLRVYWDLMHTVDVKNTIITHEPGSARDQLCPFWEAITPRGYLGWGGHSGLGSSLGLTMGAKLARPKCLAIQVTGDGAFGYNGMDFETSIREKIPILTIVINNHSISGGVPLSGKYADVAEALGGYGERVEKPDDIIPAIKRAQKAVNAGRSALLEVISRPRQRTEDMRQYWPNMRLGLTPPPLYV
jgi:thiamine pyrophosphate-dependent acetolactate synthase large subunit-like protein